MPRDSINWIIPFFLLRKDGNVTAIRSIFCALPQKIKSVPRYLYLWLAFCFTGVVTGLLVTNVTSESLRVNWTSPAGPRQFTVRYKVWVLPCLKRDSCQKNRKNLAKTFWCEIRHTLVSGRVLRSIPLMNLLKSLPHFLDGTARSFWMYS